MAEKNPKVTLWLVRSGFDVTMTKPLYVVKRAQNTVTPQVGTRLEEGEIQGLIDAGVIVNLA